MKLRIIVVLLFASFLQSCAITLKNIEDTANLENNEGILVVGLHTNWEGHRIWSLASLELAFKGEADPENTYRKLEFQGENFYSVIKLPADKYTFYRQILGIMHLDINDESSFVIKPGTITYIGDIFSHLANTDGVIIENLLGIQPTSTITIVNVRNTVRAYLRDNYPALYAKNPMEVDIVSITPTHGSLSIL